MSHKHGTYLGGIRTVEDLRLRSRVDDETGCWHYGLRLSNGVPHLQFVDHNGKRVNACGRRAALTLALGRDLPAGHIAYPKMCCPSDDCVNPDHARSGTRKSHGQYLHATGKTKSAAKTAAARKTVYSKVAKLNIEKAREIRASNEALKTLAERYNTSMSRVSAIRLGKSWKDSAPGSSVFNWRPA